MIGHDVLGGIWQSIGKMIIADSARNTAITPEILEMLAMMHHRGIMPDSLYRYNPPEDRSALRPPPTLHLLSSQILTSLSDAAWRAHEKCVLDEAKANGGLDTSNRPEIPGSMYRVRVSGLTHEVWLELVLWACLHGGWTVHGAAILEDLPKHKPDAWSALSWREIVKPVISAGQEKAIDWDELRYLFNTQSLEADTEIRERQRKQVSKTVSAEVVTAYVDALVSTISVGVGERGTSPGTVVRLVEMLKSFLARNNLDLKLFHGIPSSSVSSNRKALTSLPSQHSLRGP